MASVAQTLRNNQNAEINRQIQASNFGNAPVEIPRNDNDAALAAHIQETREQSAEYAKLQTEENRQKWEAIATANFQRKQAQDAGVADRVNAEKQNQASQNVSEGDRLAYQMQALTSTFEPNWTPETLPIDQLRQLSSLREQVNRLAASTGTQGLEDGVLESGGPLAPVNVLRPARQNQRLNPQTFPDGKMYQLENLPDGNLKVKLATGEEFTGDPISVTQKLAESKVNTAVWARQKVEDAERQYQQRQPTNQPTEQPANQQTQPSGSLASDLAARQADAMAQQFGFSNKNEMQQWGETVNQKMETIAQFERQQQATDFITKCPEFPGTQEAIDSIARIMDNLGLAETSENMQACHGLAIQRGMYEPISQQALQMANGTAQPIHRQAPPPMLRSNNPEITMQSPDPYNMNLADLRRAAIQQELTGGGGRR